MSLTTVAIVLAVVLAIIWFGQRSIMYFPDSNVPAPRDVGLPSAEIVRLETEDKLELAGWFVRPQGPASGYTVIVFNGNAGHRGHRAALADRLSRLGLAVLLFDYRGYGGNPGLPHERGIVRDARAALAYVRSRGDVDPRRIVFFGESLGTGVAVQLALDYPPAAIVLRSPFSSFAALARVHYPVIPARWLLRDRYDSIGMIGKVVSPLVVIAGDRDSIVPIEDTQLLFERANEPKRLVIVAGADHNDEALSEGPEVMDAVRDWLEIPAPPTK